MNIVVIGGGFVGQLVQLALPDARVFDHRKEPPLDHLETRRGPQYLWQPIPGVQNEEFKVTTLVDGEKPTELGIRAYKQKIGKLNDGGDWGRQFQHETVGYHAHLPKPRVEYGRTIRMVDLPGQAIGLDSEVIKYDVLINTIPLPKFIDLLIVGPSINEKFRNDPIYMTLYPDRDRRRFREMKEGIVLDYITAPKNPVYRQTTRDGDLFCESITPIDGSVKIFPGKIHPHDEAAHAIAQLAAFDCYCFGRFATWRPDELAHETWEDIMAWKAAKV
jgi:hypothetical protein